MAARHAPIRTLADAERYFRAMGCSSFHMLREDPERYDEYRALGVPRETERRWRTEALAEALATLLGGHARQASWAHSVISEHIFNLREPERLPDLLAATRYVLDHGDDLDAVVAAETLNGRQALKYRSGMIVFAREVGGSGAAASFIDLARQLAEKARALPGGPAGLPDWTTPAELRERAQRALERTAAVEALLRDEAKGGR